ncbi:hypothetical protein PS1_003206 [Malus domestica]
MMNFRHDDLQHYIADLQHSIADLSVHRSRQEDFQQTVLEELRALKIQNPTPPVSQIPIGTIPIPLGSTPFSVVHPTLPPPTWGSSPPQPIPHTHPSTSHLAAGPSSSPFIPNPLHTLSHSTSRPLPSHYFPPFASDPTFFPWTTDPPPYHPPSPPFAGPKHLKIELPRFFGEDPYGWLAMADEFLDYHEIEDRRRVTVPGLHLGSDAAHWLRWFKLRFPLSSWATFTTQLLQRFGPTESLNFHMAPSHITQTGSVEDY